MTITTNTDLDREIPAAARPVLIDFVGPVVRPPQRTRAQTTRSLRTWRMPKRAAA